MFSELKKNIDQLLRHVFREDAIDNDGTILKKIKKEWLTNKRMHKRQLSRCWLCHKISFRVS